MQYPAKNDQSYLYALAHRLNHRKRTFGHPFYRNPSEAGITRYRHGHRRSVEAEAKEESPRDRNYISVFSRDPRLSNKTLLLATLSFGS